MQNTVSYENEFGLHKNEPVAGPFSYKGFRTNTRLTQSQNATQEWHILNVGCTWFVLMRTYTSNF